MHKLETETLSEIVNEGSGKIEKGYSGWSDSVVELAATLLLERSIGLE